MADTFTSNLNLTKPEVGASTDNWGNKLNNNLDTLDGIFSATGSPVNLKFASANFDDNAKAIFGTGSGDLEIFHDGSNSYIVDNGTGDLLIRGININLQSTSGEDYINCTNNGGVILRFDNQSKLNTLSTGINVSGNIAVSGTVDGVDLSALPTVAISGSYNDLTNKPTIPTNNNQLTNGAGYITSFTDTTYSAGAGISISGTVIRCTIDSPAEVGLGNLSANGNVVSGDFLASGNITAYSSRKLKSDIQTIDNALDKVSQMRGVTFIKNGELSSGVIAEELENVAPELVQDGEYKSVAYGNIVGYLIESIKELKQELQELRGV